MKRGRILDPSLIQTIVKTFKGIFYFGNGQNKVSRMPVATARLAKPSDPAPAPIIGTTAD